MANLKTSEMESFSFSDFPEDVQLCILSFLSPPEIFTFAFTSKRFLSLCKDDYKLWFTLCERRWGSKTQIAKWGNGKVTYRLLYETLSEWENLIGFWRRSGQANFGGQSSPLIFFDWGPSYLVGFRVSPSIDGSDRVVKTPFLWMGLAPDGVANFLVTNGIGRDFANMGQLGFLGESDLVPVNLSLIGKSHFVMKENARLGYAKYPDQSRKNGFRRSSSFSNLQRDELEDLMGMTSGPPGSLPGRLTSEMYQYFANRTSPGSDRAARRQRRREKERQARRTREPEHFVKIDNCSPTPSRPLQGLWKGICDGMNLDFYLVVYDDLGGITCRRVGDSSEHSSGYTPVFWASNATSLESPFSPEEEHLYSCRVHLRPFTEADDTCSQLSHMGNELVSRIININSSYDPVMPDTRASSSIPQLVQGRIWQYLNGTFGFGFLQDNVIIDLKHIAQNGCLLDTTDELCSN